ncbi:hypothetical protein VP01_4656g2 [Puccinia sorghi]|uniref:Uncharacterized protein n=1 Tax=Puccinia sorghi TaxID=27349 RepID=A0A0L6UQ79_9BASI|nr:hypothetical protein VP01_4656g2 [Puccinia sorghi]
MHFSSAVKSFILISIHCQGIIGLQIFNCPDPKTPVGLCRRATKLDANSEPLSFAISQATQAGQTATCEQVAFNNFPADNAMCCTVEFGALTGRITLDAPNAFSTVNADALTGTCAVVPSAVP